MHLKRNEIPRAWPIPRKGSKYIAVASHNKNASMPLVYVLRELLKVVKTRKEAQYLTRSGDVKINNKVRKNDAFPVSFFDVVSLEKIGRHYRLNIVNKKFKLEEISEKKKDEKIVKIIGKKIIGKDKIQMNLQDGQNFLFKDKFKTGDSAVVNTKENKIAKILELKPGAKVEITSGKHAGEQGIFKESVSLEREKRYEIKLKDKEVSLPLKTLLVIG